MNKKIKFSLIMATLGRKDEVDALLNSLVIQTYKCFELIIIDQNSDERVCDIYVKYKNCIDIIYIKSDKKGLSYNRNIGLEKCRGDIVAFLDDDCEYNYDTMERVAAFFISSHYDFFTCNTKEKNSNKTIFNAPKTSTEVNIFNFMRTGVSITIFVRYDKIKKFKFDEQLGLGARFGSAEESDLLLFLIKNNNKGFYCSDIYIYHPCKDNTIEKSFSYGKGYGALFKKAVFVYKYYFLFFFFLNVIIKEVIKVCIYPYEKGRVTSIKARLYGFIFYKFV
jgi:glycosyltransferase involved in cell wall biosynthesis